MGRKYAFDAQCYFLAGHFLEANACEAAKRELAQDIQDAVESFMEGRDREAIPGDVMAGAEAPFAKNH
jgi:hypothetical protein